MDQITPAIRLFRQIALEPNELVNAVALRKLRVWLSHDVGRVVDELSRRPTFREHAGWVIHSLRNGSNSEERRVVDRLESALQDAAKGYAKLLNNPRITAQLHACFPPRSHNVGETVEIRSDSAPRVLKRRVGLIDESEMEMSQLRHFSNQGSNEYALVRIDDYFEPQQGYVQDQNGTHIQAASHIVSLNPELHPVGNFVLQSANRRLDESLRLLTTIRRKVATAIRELRREYAGQKLVEAAWDRLQSELHVYRATFQSGQKNDLRNACIVLTQIYAAFHPAPDLDWLGLPDRLIQNGKVVLQHRIQGFRGGELFERVNGALIRLQRLYEDGAPLLSAFEEGVASGDLVLISDERTLYWEGSPVLFAAHTHHKSWELLLPLVKKARTGGFVTERDVFGERITGRSGMAMRMQRLKELLPGSLRKLILPGPDPRTYRLQIERHRIHLL